MKHRKNHGKVTPEYFDKVKHLFSLGYQVKDVVKLEGRAHSTITDICNAESFEHYKALSQKRFAKFKAEPSVVQQELPFDEEPKEEVGEVKELTHEEFTSLSSALILIKLDEILRILKGGE